MDLWWNYIIGTQLAFFNNQNVDIWKEDLGSILFFSFSFLGESKGVREIFIFTPCMQVLHPQSMRPAREGNIPVRVKNSYNPKAPGTLITKTRDMSKVCSSWNFVIQALEESNSTDHFLHLNELQAVLTSIVLKQNVTMLDIVSTCMLGQFGFLAKVRNCFLIWFCSVTCCLHGWC